MDFREELELKYEKQAIICSIGTVEEKHYICIIYHTYFQETLQGISQLIDYWLFATPWWNL